MADPLSIAASSFAVLGVAEQVCRTIKELFTFLSAIKSAPREIQQLQSQLLDLDSILGDVRAYCSESQSQPGQQNIVPAFISSLSGFKHELEVLRLTLNLPKAGKVDLGDRIKWVLLKEQKAVQSIQRLESHKATLIAALTIVGRRNDVVLHKVVGEIRAQLDGLMVKQDESKKAPNRIFQVSSTSSDFFTGRDKELDLIEKIFANPNTTAQRRVVVWGCAGAGKTQLALAFAHRHEKNYDAVFWVTASSAEILQRSFAGLSRHLMLPEGEYPDLDQSSPSQLKAVTAVMSWLQQNDNWLLIIDNADDLKAVNIKSYFPATTRGCMIITSRNVQAVSFGAGIELGEMHPNEAKALLLARAGVHCPSEEDETEAASIGQSLGYLALAIDHAGAYVQSVCGTLEDYHEQLKTSRAETLKDKPDVSTYEESVFRTFEISFEKITERNASAAALLIALGFFDQESAAESLIITFLGEAIDILKPILNDKIKYNAALQELLRSHWSVERSKAEQNS